MNCTYRAEITAACPVDQGTDTYTLIVRSPRTIPVEVILAAVKAATEKPCYQEDLTQALAQQLRCDVETEGIHSGVLTTCVCKA